jgi:TonB family protein
MRSLEGYILPAAVTLLLHAALLVFLTVNWQPAHEPLVKPAPRHVKARLVSLEKSGAKQPRQAAPKPPQPKPEPPKPKPEPPKPEPKPEPPKPEPPKPKPEPPKPKPEPKPQPKPEPKPKPKPEPPKPDPKVQEEARKREQARREAEQKEKQKKQREQQLREQQQREQELALALAAEDEAMEAGDAETTTYEEAIAMAIEDNWSRPPSARRDMQVVLRIQLIPTGEVVGVSVIKSSGDEAFDRSAINAVTKAARFPEVADAPPQVFERHLRSLQLVFRPEDLRL